MQSIKSTFIYSVIKYCTINPINGGPETNDIVLKFYAVYIIFVIGIIY